MFVSGLVVDFCAQQVPWAFHGLRMQALVDEKRKKANARLEAADDQAYSAW